MAYVRFILAVICLSLLAALARAEESLLSVPGLADTVATYAKQARAMGFVDLKGSYGGGVLLPVRTVKDSAGAKYAALGFGGTIKEGEHFRPRLAGVLDASVILRRLEVGWGWWDNHTDKLKLPDFWVGPSLETPMPGDSVTWKDFGNAKTWAGYAGVALSIGF